MYGIAGAVVFRAIMIALGAATLQQFEAVNLVFAGILLFSSYKVLTFLLLLEWHWSIWV
jgi:predicted tellurium resistance membrane protein TerC